jgi:Ca2+/Na+ antiporter
MVNKDNIAFNVTSFIYALLMLEFGADKFINHTAISARRTGISQAIIGLLIARPQDLNVK